MVVGGVWPMPVVGLGADLGSGTEPPALRVARCSENNFDLRLNDAARFANVQIGVEVARTAERVARHVPEVVLVRGCCELGSRHASYIRRTASILPSPQVV